MKISVIIPVYNAAAFVEKAVESALQFEEVKEILLIEDASPDNALDICKELERKHKRVKLFQHPDKKNHGAGASRNLGIKNASCPYIAFLDADDFYLPNRFDEDKRVFAEHPGADGVYNAIGFYYYSNEGKHRFKNYGYPDLFSLSGKVCPEGLPYVLLGFHKVKGDFSIIALTVKKSLLIKCGLFNEKLRLHQDTDLTIKLSILGKLFPGEIEEPVAMYGVHENNLITANENVFQSRALFYSELKKWGKDNNIVEGLFKIMDAHYLLNKIKGSSWISALGYFIKGVLKNKTLLLHKKFFNSAVNRVSGQGFLGATVLRIKEKIQISVFEVPLS